MQGSIENAAYSCWREMLNLNFCMYIHCISVHTQRKMWDGPFFQDTYCFFIHAHYIPYFILINFFFNKCVVEI